MPPTIGSAVAPVWTLVLNAGSTVSVSSGNGTLNTWAGPVNLNGAATFTGGNTGYSETFSELGEEVKNRLSQSY